MYQRVTTAKEIRNFHGVKIYPVATMADEHGGIAHIWIDDHCYVLGLQKTQRITSDDKEPTTYVMPVHHIFKEAFDVMKTLPQLG